MSLAFPPNDPFAFFRQFWQPSNPALQSFMPALSEEEIERKLVELRVVQNWLTMSSGLIELQIKTLEMQKAGLASLKPRQEG